MKDIEGSRPVLIVDGEFRIHLRTKEITIEKSQYSANFVVFSKEYSLESKLRKRTIKFESEKMKNLPASAKLVYKILQHEGSMAQKEIINSSLLPERTVRYALNILIKTGVIVSEPDLTDARQTIYRI